MPEAWKDEKIDELKRELQLTDELLAERNRVLEAIPACSVHGSQCIPHALEWIKQHKETLSMRWEYKLMPLPNFRDPQFNYKELEGRLNTLGHEGWEWCREEAGFWVFKRLETPSEDVVSRILREAYGSQTWS